MSDYMYFDLQPLDHLGNGYMAQPPLVTTEHPVTLVAFVLSKIYFLKECFISWRLGDRCL